MKENKCPECDKITDAATQVGGNNKPSEGDISLCIYCGAINQFDNDNNIISLPNDKLEEIKEYEPDTYKMIINTVIGIKSRNFK